MKRVELGAYFGSHCQVFLTPVEVEGVLERGLCFARFSRLFKDVREVAVVVSLHVERVCLLDERNGFADELLGLAVFAAVCVDARQNSSPLRLGGEVRLGHEFAAKLRQWLGIVIASEFA